MRYRNDNRDRKVDDQDEIRSENELLKLKLEREGVMGSNGSAHRPTREDQWLNSVYNFEQQYKGANLIKVYDFLGRPAVKKMHELKPVEIGSELDRIQSLMEEKGMTLDCSGDYDHAIIYRFVTEELFLHEIEDVSMAGTVIHFIYEEFHPNHELDLRRYAGELIEILFRKKWDRFDSHCFAGHVGFKGRIYDNEGIADIIQAFQEAHESFSVEQFEIQNVKFDLAKEHAGVDARIRYRALGNRYRYFDGLCKITFLFQWGYWYIDGFKLPGFGND
jgi:hypothetical protein